MKGQRIIVYLTRGGILKITSEESEKIFETNNFKKTSKLSKQNVQKCRKKRTKKEITRRSNSDINTSFSEL